MLILWLHGTTKKTTIPRMLSTKIETYTENELYTENGQVQECILQRIGRILPIASIMKTTEGCGPFGVYISYLGIARLGDPSHIEEISKKYLNLTRHYQRSRQSRDPSIFVKPIILFLFLRFLPHNIIVERHFFYFAEMFLYGICTIVLLFKYYCCCCRKQTDHESIVESSPSHSTGKTSPGQYYLSQE